MSSWCCRGGCVEPAGSGVASHGRSRCLHGGEETHGSRCQPSLVPGRQEKLGCWERAALLLFQPLVISVIAGWAGRPGERRCLGSPPGSVPSPAAAPRVPAGDPPPYPPCRSFCPSLYGGFQMTEGKGWVANSETEPEMQHLRWAAAEKERFRAAPGRRAGANCRA